MRSKIKVLYDIDNYFNNINKDWLLFLQQYGPLMQPRLQQQQEQLRQQQDQLRHQQLMTIQRQQQERYAQMPLPKAPAAVIDVSL